MKRIFRWALTAAATGLAAASLAAPAYASTSIGSFSISPSTRQAGGAPDLHITANFNNSWGDSPNNLTLSLAPGLLANPTAAGTCSWFWFSVNLCPSDSQIGGGSVTVNIPALFFFGFTAPVGARVYLVQPTDPTQAARIGLIMNVLGVPLESTAAPVTVRTQTGNVGLNVNFAHLPNSWNWYPLHVQGIDLTIWGSHDGHALTRNPTNCSTATSNMAVNSYGSSTYSHASTSFTPTGCNTLAYNPSVSAVATLVNTGLSPVTYGVDIKQNPGDASTQSLTITTPPALSPSFGALGACTNVPAGQTCETVGTVTATTPFLPVPLTGQALLVSDPGNPPELTLQFSNPVPLTIHSKTTLTSNPLVLTATFDQIPDIPLTDLTVKFDGTLATTLWVANGSALCTPPQPTATAFTADNGATASVSTATTVLGCPTG